MKLIYILTFIIINACVVHTSYAHDETEIHGVAPLNNTNWPSTIAESWQEIDRSLVQVKHFLDEGNFKLMHKAIRNMTIAVRALQQEIYTENSEKLSQMTHFLNKLTRSLNDLYAIIKNENLDSISKELNNIEETVEKVRKNHPE